MKFGDAIKVILKHEGGYVNDSDDPGGETNMGISKRAYPEIDIKRLTEAEATAIYYDDYWRPARVEDVPENLRLIYFEDRKSVCRERV